MPPVNWVEDKALKLFPMFPFFHFCYLFLLINHCVLLLLVSVFWCPYRFVCSWLDYEIYSGGGPSVYVYCVVCYRVIVVPYVRRVVMSLHTITLLMTIRNAQRTINFLESLKVFSAHHPSFLPLRFICQLTYL